MEITATVADLDAAIAAKAMKGMDWDQPCECLMAKAIGRTTGARASCGLTSATIAGHTYGVPDAVQQLINLFDNESYDVLRGALPVTFTLEAQ